MAKVIIRNVAPNIIPIKDMKIGQWGIMKNLSNYYNGYLYRLNYNDTLTSIDGEEAGVPHSWNEAKKWIGDTLIEILPPGTILEITI